MKAEEDGSRVIKQEIEFSERDAGKENTTENSEGSLVDRAMVSPESPEIIASNCLDLRLTRKLKNLNKFGGKNEKSLTLRLVPRFQFRLCDSFLVLELGWPFLAAGKDSL